MFAILGRTNMLSYTGSLTLLSKPDTVNPLDVISKIV